MNIPLNDRGYHWLLRVQLFDTHRFVGVVNNTNTTYRDDDEAPPVMAYVLYRIDYATARATVISSYVDPLENCACKLRGRTVVRVSERM